MHSEKERKPKHIKCSGFPLSVITNYGGPRGLKWCGPFQINLIIVQVA